MNIVHHYLQLLVRELRSEIPEVERLLVVQGERQICVLVRIMRTQVRNPGIYFGLTASTA